MDNGRGMHLNVECTILITVTSLLPDGMLLLLRMTHG
jgi:hypothetical protein